MSKKIFSIKTLLSLCAVVCLTVATGLLCLPKRMTAKAENGNNIVANVKQLEYFSDGDTLIVFFENTDYMTATEWGTESSEAYKWVSSLKLEDKENYNVYNAVLDKNLDAYNFGEYILLDGVPLKDYNYTLTANKFQRVHSLGITLNTAGVMGKVEKITFKEGCTLPTLHHAYFGVEEYSAIVFEEEANYRSKNGGWIKAYPFDGYELGVEYDGCEKYFFKRMREADGTGSYKGHVESPAYEFTDALHGYGWDDEGYSLASTGETKKGTLLVYEFINPINVKEIGLIRLRVYSNIPRTFVSYNANEVTKDDLGPVLEMYSVSGGFSTITLLSSLYADEDGMIETLVFQFTNDGVNEKGEKQQFFLASFSLGENTINTDVYDDSFFIQDLEGCYDLTYRFNKVGEFNEGAAVDTSKILINGVSLDEINAEGDYAQAEWNTVQGIYQINVRLDKAYNGEGALKNAELGFAGNNMTVEQGTLFPNGEALDSSYTCRIFAGEKFVDYELFEEYKETAVTNIRWEMDVNSANNIHMYVDFDAQVSSQTYYHANQVESWRKTALVAYDGNMYDEEFTKVFIAGGFKASLYNSIYINGKALYEWQAKDKLPTCLFIQYAQTSGSVLDFSVDSNSQSYAELLPLFEAGEGVTIEIKQGFKFTTGIRTEKDYKFVLEDGKFVSKTLTNNMTVYYNGRPVSQGEQIVSNTEALLENLKVIGTNGYATTLEREGDVVTITVNAEGFEAFTFSVKEEIILEPVESGNEQGNQAGCASSVSASSMVLGGMLLLAATAVMLRRKNDEE